VPKTKAKSKVKPKVKVKSKAKPAAKTSAAKKAPAKKALAKKAPVKAAAAKSKTKKVVSKAARQVTAKKISAKPAAKKIAWADFFSPLGNRVLIERKEAETKTAGGLFIPDFAQEKPNHATVLVAGPGARSKTGRLQPLDVQVGDTVLISSYAGMPIKLQGLDLMLIKEEEIHAILP
jgi:chaperonin GroES